MSVTYVLHAFFRSHSQGPCVQFVSLEGVLGPSCSIWDAFGILLDSFWMTFWRLVVLVRIATPLCRKPTFWCSGGSHFCAFSLLFRRIFYMFGVCVLFGVLLPLHVAKGPRKTHRCPLKKQEIPKQTKNRQTADKQQTTMLPKDDQQMTLN